MSLQPFRGRADRYATRRRANALTDVPGRSAGTSTTDKPLNLNDSGAVMHKAFSRPGFSATTNNSCG